MSASVTANETSPADRDFAGPNKNRTIAGAIKALFGQASKILTRLDEDAPQPSRRRRGETEKDFGPAAARILRRATKKTAYRAARAWLSDTLDWLNLWQANAGENNLDDDFSAKEDRYFPQP
jgi:hypothetical protein